MSEKNCDQLQLFALKLKSQRKQKELSKKEVANLVGISKKKQAKYERGEKPPCIKYLFKLFNIGFDLNELGINDVFSERYDEMILAIYRLSSSKKRQKILEILLSDLSQEHKTYTNHNSAVMAGKQVIETNKSKTITTVIYLDI